MSKLPRRVAPGDRLTASWLNRLLDYLRSRELRAGPGIEISRTPSGTTVNARPRRSGSGGSELDVCIGVVDTASSTSDYVYVRTYPNSTVGSAGPRVRLHMPCVFRRSPVVPGDVLLCHACAVTVTAEGEDT